MTSLTYAAVTPARDEADNLPRLAYALTHQTVLPSAWIVVDDGSQDSSRRLVEEVATVHPWVEVIDSPGAQGGDSLALGRTQGRDVVAFNAGVAALEFEPDIVLKLDADVSFEPDFFERLLREFEADAQLGIAGGVCLEREDGTWREKFVTGDHVRGATRAYRWACLQAVSPLVAQLGWDGIDEAKAAARGWHVRSIATLPFHHHRQVGRRDGTRKSWESQGAAARFMGYRCSYFAVRCLYRATRDPRALAMLLGWLKAAVRREPVYDDEEVTSYLRRQQRIRELPLRAREAVGRRL